MKLGAAGWLLAAIAIVIIAVQAFAHRGAPGRILELEEANAQLVTADSQATAQIALYRAAVAEADERAQQDSIAAQAALDAAAAQTSAAEGKLREALTGQPVLIALVDSLVAAHEAELRLERERRTRGDILRLAQIASRDSLIDAQAFVITIKDERIVNLEEQVGIWRREARPPFAIRLWRSAKKGLLVSACAGAGAALYTDSPEYGAMAGAGVCSLVF